MTETARVTWNICRPKYLSNITQQSSVSESMMVGGNAYGPTSSVTSALNAGGTVAILCLSKSKNTTPCLALQTTRSSAELVIWKQTSQPYLLKRAIPTSISSTSLANDSDR